MNILIVHYNTPYVTECLVKSINKYVGTGCTIYIFDNSDKSPFTYKQDNIVVFDNTKGQIINFEGELKKYPNRGGEASGKYISFKHCISVDKCFDLINENFVLLDSDVLLKKDIKELCDNENIFCGETETKKPSKTRLLPFCCFFNIEKCKSKKIRYFYSGQMHGLNKYSDGKFYDTGAAFYEHAKNEKHKLIKLDDYIIHYRSASWICDYSLKRKNEKITAEEWVYKNRQYWLTEKEMENKRVIYTCITGGYENIVDPSFVQADFDYICFTDNMDQETNVWKLRPIPEELLSLSKVKQQRIIKIMPHKYLPEYDESLWIDGAMDVTSNVNNFIAKYCSDSNKSIFIRKHPNRKCIYKEGATCIKTSKDKAENINKQLDRYRKEGFPSDFGLVETNIIYRKHNDPYCKQLMELWAKEVTNGSHRDQLSFNYALWKVGNEGFKYIDVSVSNSVYFKWYNLHNRKPKNTTANSNDDILKKKSIVEIMYHSQYLY